MVKGLVVFVVLWVLAVTLDNVTTYIGIECCGLEEANVFQRPIVYSTPFICWFLDDLAIMIGVIYVYKFWYARNPRVAAAWLVHALVARFFPVLWNFYVLSTV